MSAVRRWRCQVSRALVATLAFVAALAPGVAAIVDAGPAARAISQRFASHVEETGRQHGVRAHIDDCALCQIATRSGAERPDSPRPALALAPLPVAEADRTVSHIHRARWSAPSRAPPTA